MVAGRVSVMPMGMGSVGSHEFRSSRTATVISNKISFFSVQGVGAPRLSPGRERGASQRSPFMCVRACCYAVESYISHKSTSPTSPRVKSSPEGAAAINVPGYKNRPAGPHLTESPKITRRPSCPRCQGRRSRQTERMAGMREKKPPTPPAPPQLVLVVATEARRVGRVFRSFSSMSVVVACYRNLPGLEISDIYRASISAPAARICSSRDARQHRPGGYRHSAHHYYRSV